MRGKKQNLVIGSGLAGATIANQLTTKLDEKVLVVDSKDHIAGNCYDYYDQNGICIQKYGSHIFHTNDDTVWEYLSNFCEWNTYQHKVIGVIDGIETPIPFNLNSIYDVFPKDLAKRLEEKLLEKFEYNKKVPILEFKKQNDEDLQLLADFVYEKVFLNYTIKQWGLKPENIDNSVTARVPVFISNDNRYFQDIHQGIPIGGYTAMISNMLKNPNIEVKLNTEFSDIKNSLEYDRLFFTGSIDEFFDYKFGILPYRSVYFEMEEHNQEFYQKNAVVNYPNDNDFTRISEYKYYLNDKSEKTVIAKEYSENFKLGKNDRYYPIPKDENTDLYNQYLKEATKLDNVYFLGRLGDYKYYNMDQVVKRALDVFNGLH
ncbi:MAG: UDP-galactopyranose mutase [Candidatus Gastranaerophilales bacterium]|nr:UDP-galactopyranose mutase [Candidatus Gastranaerophilales bacterium]